MTKQDPIPKEHLAALIKTEQLEAQGKLTYITFDELKRSTEALLKESDDVKTL